MQSGRAGNHRMMKRGVSRTIQKGERRLEYLISVGPAIRSQFDLLGIRTVAELARCDPDELYRDICRATGKRCDICVLDVYCAAVAQARNPGLPHEQCVWWYYSRIRKASSKTRRIK
jgi:hypothetical protein